MNHLSRRRFVQGVGVAGLGLLAGCERLPWHAQPPKVPRLGFLSPNAPGVADYEVQGFLKGLQDLGYADGQNIAIEYRWAAGDPERLPALAVELAQLNLDIILAGGSTAALAANHATNTIPIVVAASSDPVESGLVTSLARPGGSVTGLSLVGWQLSAKRVELLHEAVPSVTRVAVLAYPRSPTADPMWDETQIGAQALHLPLHRLDVDRPDGFVGAFEAAAQEGADGLIVLANQYFAREPTRIVELAARYRLPAMYASRSFMDVGGLMSYGADVGDSYQRAAYYVDRILKGTKPADLPVEQPMTFEFVINLQTAQALGLTIPPHVLLQATEVIQ